MRAEPEYRTQGRIPTKSPELERSYEESSLPEKATSRGALNDLLVRLRLG